MIKNNSLSYIHWSVYIGGALTFASLAFCALLILKAYQNLPSYLNTKSIELSAHFLGKDKSIVLLFLTALTGIGSTVKLYKTQNQKSLLEKETNITAFIQHFIKNSREVCIKKLTEFAQGEKLDDFPTSPSMHKNLSEDLPDLYDCMYNKVCHATAIAFVLHGIKEGLLEKKPKKKYRGEDQLHEIQNAVLTPFSASRISIQKGDIIHEFIIVNLHSKAFLIQSDVWRQMTVEAPNGCLEITEEDIKTIFSKTPASSTVMGYNHPCPISIKAVDTYSIR